MYKKEDVTRLLADVGKMVKEPVVAADAKPASESTRYLGNRDMPEHVLTATPLSNPGNVDLSALEMGEPSHFGLTVHAYDPVSGETFVVARPHIAQIGQSEIFLTPNQLATAVASARVNRLHRDRAMGFVAPLTKAQHDAGLQARKDASKKAEAEHQEAVKHAASAAPADKAEADRQVVVKKAEVDRLAAEYKKAVADAEAAQKTAAAAPKAEKAAEGGVWPRTDAQKAQVQSTPVQPPRPNPGP